MIRKGRLLEAIHAIVACAATLAFAAVTGCGVGAANAPRCSLPPSPGLGAHATGAWSMQSVARMTVPVTAVGLSPITADREAETPRLRKARRRAPGAPETASSALTHRRPHPIGATPRSRSAGAPGAPRARAAPGLTRSITGVGSGPRKEDHDAEANLVRNARRRAPGALETTSSASSPSGHRVAGAAHRSGRVTDSAAERNSPMNSPPVPRSEPNRFSNALRRRGPMPGTASNADPNVRRPLTLR